MYRLVIQDCIVVVYLRDENEFENAINITALYQD